MTRIEAHWLTDEATQNVFELLDGYSTYAVGGCIRNTLLSQPVKDIDLATAARPETVMELAAINGLRAVPTGIEHGTVTIIVKNVPFEITTFRLDVETDGRRAVVAFADGIDEDALRRDFTINALYADAKGRVLDPVNGLKDIADRRVRFIESADRRIREDYLRSLRFFRFHAWYGDPNAGMDADALDAISRNLGGLETLSRERVGSELLRLLSAPDPAPAVATMRSTGVLHSVLPDSDDTGLAPLVALEQELGVDPDALRRFAVLGGAFEDLRLSGADLSRVQLVVANIGTEDRVVGYRHGNAVGRDAVLVTAALTGTALQTNALETVAKGASATFPVRAADLMPELEGKPLGDKLRRLEDAWVESGFTLSRDELLSKG